MWSVDDVFAKLFAIANSCVFFACVIIPSCSSQQCISTVIHGGRRGKKRVATKQKQATEGLARGYVRMRFSECIIWRSRIENEVNCWAQSSRRVIMSGSGFKVTSTCSLLSLSMSILYICCRRDEKHSVTLYTLVVNLRAVNERENVNHRMNQKNDNLEWFT